MSDPASPISSTTQYYRPVQIFVARPPRQRTWLYVLFFFLTVVTTLVMGARMQYNFQHGLTALSLRDESPGLLTSFSWALGHPSNLLLGLPFSLTLMLILFAHEMGHYLFCRYYRVYATLPFFVPFPSLIGTLGAFIRIKSPIRSRSALFDIGIAGPIAGFVFACVALIIGLQLSKPGAVALEPDVSLVPLGIYRWMGWLLWAVLLGLSGLRHPMVPEFPGIDRGRRWVALMGAVMLYLTFTATPFTGASLRDVIIGLRPH